MGQRGSKSLRVRRRSVLQGVGGAAATVALGCGSDVSGSGTTAQTGSGGGDATVGAGGDTSVGVGGQGGGEGAHGGEGGQGGQGGQGGGGPSACDDPGSLSAEELLAPIDTIVVLMLENRSFDHYLGGSLRLAEMRADIEGLTGNEMLPHPEGGTVAPYAMQNLEPSSPPHQWNAVHEQWNGGLNDQFVMVNDGAAVPEEAVGYYLRAQLPIHHALADHYAVCNRMHCSVLAGTWPNRFYLHGASSNGQQENLPVLGFQSLWGPLKNAGLTVRNYHHGVAWCTGAYFKLDDLALFDSFKSAAASGTLPNFSIIDPQFFGGGANDDHPGNANVPLAQLLISDVYSTLAQSPQWQSCLLVVTYDEHGGFYDHVPPPPAVDGDPDFDVMGFRVPALVAGPYVRQGCAVNTVFDHASVLATLSKRWGIATLNQRHATANDLSSCIDPAFVSQRNPQPPASMPMLDISMSALTAHFEAVKRGAVPPQHPELMRALADAGYKRTVLRRFDPAGMLSRHLEDCVRRGLARIVS